MLPFIPDATSAVIVVSKKHLVQDEVACERERGVTLESIAVWG